MNSKRLKLIFINFLVFIIFFILGIASLEIFSSINKSEIPNKGLAFDEFLGWESIPPLQYINKSDKKAKRIAFIGDSFTHGQLWTSLTVESLNKDFKTKGYSLGVSGYSNLQSFLKLRKYFKEINPDLVILLFYAWNDMRDNYNKPGILYSPNTERRPYLDKNYQINESFSISEKNWFRDLNIYRDYIIINKLRLNKLIVKIFGIDQISKSAINLNLDYIFKDSWVPFYLKEKENSHYVKSSWDTTFTILKKLDKFVKSHNKKLIIVGIDNAFTVDDDVKEAWVDEIKNFDIYKNIKILAKFCEENNIFFIDGLSKLKDARGKMDKKIYNYPLGNLSGHLEKEGHLTISRSVVEFINENKLLE